MQRYPKPSDPEQLEKPLAFVLGNVAGGLEEFVHIDKEVITVDGSEVSKLRCFTLRKRRTAHCIREQACNWNDIGHPVTKCGFTFEASRDTLLFLHLWNVLSCNSAHRLR